MLVLEFKAVSFYLNTSENIFTIFAEFWLYFSMASFTNPYLIFITLSQDTSSLDNWV